jgi:hypothetical protein
MNDWRKALDTGLSITQSSDPDAIDVEVTVVLAHAGSDLPSPSGMVAIVSLMIWAETPEDGIKIWEKFTKTILDNSNHYLIVPLKQPTLVAATDVTKGSADSYPPGARFKTQAHMGDEYIHNHNMPRAELEASLEPVVEMWLSSTPSPPPPPSHTLVVLMHDKLESKVHHGKKLALGYTPSIGVQTYAIYQDASMDMTMEEQLRQAHSKLIDHPHFKTSLVEGNTRSLGIESGFTKEAFAEMKGLVDMLDPKGLFQMCRQNHELLINHQSATMNKWVVS